MHKRWIRPLAFLIVGMSSVVNSDVRGIDCKKASAAVDKLICSDKELLGLDRDMADAYFLIGGQNDFQKYVPLQREWLKQRENCADVSCLKNVYLIRIGVLQAWAEKGRISEDSEYYPRVVGEGSGTDVCRKFIYEYDFKIKSLKHPLRWRRLPNRPEDDYSSAWVSYMDLDLDGDGEYERLYRHVSNFGGFKISKDISILPIEDEIYSGKGAFKNIYSRSLLSIKANGKENLRKINQDHAEENKDLYKWAAFDHRSSIEPLFVDGAYYFFLANEYDTADQRIYAILKIKKDSGRYASEVMCHIEYNQ